MPREPPVTKMTMISVLELPKDADGVDAAEPERALHQRSDGVLDSLAASADVQVDLRVDLVDVDRRVELAGLHLEDGGDRLDGRGGPAGVAEHRLGGVDLEPPSV